MTREREYRRVLETANRLARESDVRRALFLLEDKLADARRDGNDRWVLLFAREAGLIAERHGDLTSAVEYFELVARANRSDPWVFFALGRLFERLKKPRRAKRCFERCGDLAKIEGDEDLLELVASRTLARKK